MHESDYHEFVKAMVKEVDDHESRNHWTVMRCCDMPSDTKTIMSIWSFKCKRYPDGMLNKHKACAKPKYYLSSRCKGCFIFMSV